jgi:uncharacterized membrane protein YhfC
VQLSPQIDPWFLVAQAAAIAFNIAAPLVIATIAQRRLQVGWRYWGFGALIFLLFQLLTRVPAVQLLQSLLATQLQNSQPLRLAWLAGLAVTAGLFEEWGRYVGYRWLMRGEEKTWPKAVMYGLGHGGFESIVLVGGLGLLGLINLVALSRMDLAALPLDDAQRSQITQQLSAVASAPAWLPLLGAWERIWSMALHVGLSVLVLQTFSQGRQGGLRWVWLAVAAHALADLVVIGVPVALGISGTSASLLQEALVMLAGLGGLVVARWGRRWRPN